MSRPIPKTPSAASSVTGFATLGLSATLLNALSELTLSEPTPIQKLSIPAILNGQDVIGQSKTGSGKTAAFVLPLLQLINVGVVQPQALILCPTRELCDQVLRECQKFSKHLRSIKITALSGGQPAPPQLEALKRGVHLIVGTPGRTLEYLRDGKVNTTSLKILVLDEADRLLEEGFAEEINAILANLPARKQTIFFSATFPEGIEELSRVHQKNAQRVQITESALSNIGSSIEQFIFLAEKPEKMETLLRIIEAHPSKCTLIFCRTKAAVNEIGTLLKAKHIECQVLHADLKQTVRDRTTQLFRDGGIEVLVATDIAARGLDIDILEMVINFDLPASAEIYVHRIGRTGRAGRKGKAVSIATAYEAPLVLEIEKLTGVKLKS